VSHALAPAAHSLAQLELELGGRSALIEALVTAPQTKDVKYVLGLLADPENQHKPLAELCRLAKLLPGTLLEMLERGTKLRARIIAGQIIAKGTPEMVRDVMKRAAPYEDACTECGGVGAVTQEPTADVPNPSPQPCKTCLGGGKLRYDADPEARRLGLEIAGLTSKGGGISIVNQNANVQAGSGAGLAFERLQEGLDRVLYGRSPTSEAVDAELAGGDVPD
jgi:hypothetical protein